MTGVLDREDVREKVRATTGDAWLVTHRRAAQDRGLLVGSAVLLLATLLLTLAVPRLLERAADVAVRETVLAAGPDADLVAFPLADGLADSFQPPAEAAYASAAWLTRQFGGDTEPPVVTMESAHATMRTPVGAFAADLVHVAVAQQSAPAVRWVAGSEPQAVPVAQQGGVPGGTAGPKVVEVGMSAAGAAQLGITLDDGPFTMRRHTTGDYDHVVVTGLYEPVDPAAPLWRNQPGLLSALTSPLGTATRAHLSLLVPFAGVEDMVHVVGRGAVSGTARATLRVDDLTVDRAHHLVRRIEAETVRSGRLGSSLPAVVTAFDERMSAARAQASLVVAGVATTAALCLVLAASLLTARRRPFLATERARGASIASVATRGLLEAVPVVLVACALAGGTVAWWLHEQSGSVLLTVAVALVAGLAPAVLAVREVMGAWNGRRVAADRRVRAVHRARHHARRIAVEAVVVVLAVAAVVSVRGRGLVPLEPGEVDPLLAAAPVLLAGAAALVVVRVSPAVVRGAGRWTSRSRGLAAPLAVARAQGATTGVVPLLAVTVGVALVVLCGTLVHTVRVGQQAAADQLVGAPVRLDGMLGTTTGEAVLAQIADAPAVTAVAQGSQIGRRVFGARTGLTATLLVVDTAELAEARRSMGLPVDDGLASLGRDAAPGTVPALVSPELLDRADVEGTEVLMSALNATLRLDVRGTTALTPDHGAPTLDARVATTARDDDGLVVVDRALLAAVAEQEPQPDRAWIVGPGAVSAVEAVGIPPTASSGIVVTTRDGWAEGWSRSAIPSALTTLLLAAVVVLAGLAVLALVLVVVATARERGRTLSALRTLGLDAGTARWATLGELAPLVLGGLLGGVVIGLGVPVVIGDAIGLQRLTGEPSGATVDVTWWPVAAAVAALAVALVVAVVVEQAVRRRDSLGEVLRVGER